MLFQSLFEFLCNIYSQPTFIQALNRIVIERKRQKPKFSVLGILRIATSSFYQSNSDKKKEVDDSINNLDDSSLSEHYSLDNSD